MVCRSPTTILPWSGRLTYCLGGGIWRYSARYDESYNCWYFNTNNESSDDAKNLQNNCWNDFWNFSRFNSANNSGFR